MKKRTTYIRNAVRRLLRPTPYALFLRAKGFTLVEMLVAVLLLVTAISGPLTIASRGITASVTARDRVTAHFLAQDAMEFVRYARDSNRLAGRPWLGNAAAPSLNLSSCTAVGGCYVDSTESNPPAPTSCGSPFAVACPGSQLKYSSTARMYNHGTADPQTNPNTIFWRRVYIVTPINGNANEAEVTVRVFWCYRLINASCINVQNDAIRSEVVVRENIFNWQ